MSYQRPELPDIAFRDRSGEVIDYGRRWQGGMPPDDAYSVCTHPERFAPLHAVADALIDYLLARYEASARDDPGATVDPMARRDDVMRAVRVTPADDDAAPLTFAFTRYPAVVIQAGLLHDFPAPECGCGACDESVEALADEMEAIVMAVTEGRYQETIDEGTGAAARGRGRWVPAPPQPDPNPSQAPVGAPGAGIGYRIDAGDGSHQRSGWTTGSSVATDRIVAARAVLDQLEDGWQPWRLRADA